MNTKKQTRTIICLHCQKEYQLRPSEKKKYCSRECYFAATKGENWHSYNKELVPCSECGEGILMNQFKKNQSPTHFCNSKCRKGWYEKNMSGKLSPIFKQIETTCDNCKSTISIQPSDLAKCKHHFCNKKCFNAFAGQGMKKGSNQSRWKGGDVEINCAHCNNPFMINQSRLNQSLKTNGKLFCSTTCMGKWRSETFIGDNSPVFGMKRSDETKLKQSISRKGKCIGELNHAWKGGSDRNYPYAFMELRPIVRELYNNECQICGKIGIDVHHIDYNKKNNDPSNLIVLCRDCHPTTNFNRFFWMSYFKYKTQIAV